MQVAREMPRGRPKKYAEGDEVNFSVRMPKKLHALVKAACQKRDTSMGDQIIVLLEQWTQTLPDREALQRGLDAPVSEEP